jgi:hypothetical protein
MTREQRIKQRMATLERKYRVMMTPGFQDAYGGPLLASMVSSTLAKRLGAAGTNPSWLIGDPEVKGEVTEDEGRTLKIPTVRAKFYAIRDDHEDDCPCGCGGGPVITFLLPEEY